MTLSWKDLKVQAEQLNRSVPTGGPRVSKIKDVALFPGFFDVHVHFREPGFSYKETIRTGSLAAAHGGYTGVCAMPNLNPVPDSLEHLAEEQEIIDRDAVVDVLPYASITVGEKGKELVAMETLAPYCVAFSDDGVGVQDEAMMREAMQRAKALNKLIVAHCEVNEELKPGGCIHDGLFAATHGYVGINSASEFREVQRDVRLAGKTGCAFHACHISTKESVEAIRRGKAAGYDVTGETAPHYLVMDDSMLEEYGRFKMNPPIRDVTDREALIQGILDGTLDVIATDHAPHSAEEKSRGLSKSPFGIVGLETAFPVLYTKLVREGILPLEKLIDLLAVNPRRRFGLDLRPDDFTVFALEESYPVDPEQFLTQGRATPFEGWEVYGKCLLTVHHGNVVWKDPSVELTDCEDV